MTNPGRAAPSLASLLSEAAARQATTATVRALSHAARGGHPGDPHISLFTDQGTGGHPAARFSFESDPRP